MTDNEIIKALECCNNKEADCRLCILWTENQCTKVLGKAILDLINKQKAEIERLNALSKHHQTLINMLNEGIAEAKAEAIKEFAEKVKASRDALFNTMYSGFHFNVIIDTLVKEMVGDVE